jgi:CheY-like chemotaxis protein
MSNGTLMSIKKTKTASAAAEMMRRRSRQLAVGAGRTEVDRGLIGEELKRQFRWDANAHWIQTAIKLRLTVVVGAGFFAGRRKFSDRLMASVLIVDDEDLIRWSLAQSLEEAGYGVLEAATARETLERISQAEDIRVVLLDLKLPDSSDLDLLRTLRRRAPRCRVILMTAHGSAETLDEALRAGAFRALGKPFDIGKMVGIVGEAIAA